jgi:hypothetical protein
MWAVVFMVGAILGRKREVVVMFSESWGGLKKSIPLIKGDLKRKPIAALLARPPTQ